MRRLVFSIYSQGREFLTHKPNIPEDKLPEYKKDVPTHRLYAPPYIVRSLTEMEQELHPCTIDSEVLCPVSERDHIFHMVYELDASWLVVVVCNEQAEFLEHFSIPLTKFPETTAEWLDCLRSIWDQALLLTSTTSFRWHVVIAKYGILTVPEQEAWHFLSEPYIKRFQQCRREDPLPKDLAWRSWTLIAFQAPSAFETCYSLSPLETLSFIDKDSINLPKEQLSDPEFQFTHDEAYIYLCMQYHALIEHHHVTPCAKVFDHDDIDDFYQSRWEVRRMTCDEEEKVDVFP
jgi:hypothetical protein